MVHTLQSLEAVTVSSGLGEQSSQPPEADWLTERAKLVDADLMCIEKDCILGGWVCIHSTGGQGNVVERKRTAHL